MACGFYTGAMVIQSQDYCLIYRFTVIWIDKRLHQVFMSMPSKIFWFLLQQSVAISLLVFAYFACVQPEVSWIQRCWCRVGWISGFLQDFQARAQLESLEQRHYLSSFVIWFDIARARMPLYFLGYLAFLFMISATLCTLLIVLIMRTLRKNIDKFSKTTYKLHRQFTILLTMQVNSLDL